jgi:hypothetical protein
VTGAQREFANQKALIAHAEQNGLAYAWEGTPARSRSGGISNYVADSLVGKMK